jgi:crotonobetainyl-CoA:carnitine CoA-transferase CaiB-like acyl-CoA transferase
MSSRKPIFGPLQGIRILDLTRLLPGPLGTMLMADMGAEVIKIEDPNYPDYVRAFPPYLNGESANYLAFNRSKLSLVLDYQSSEGKKLFFELLKTADVVVEQFRPGSLDKMGIGYEVAKTINPKIIYVSVTGYGQNGPYAHLAGHDLNYIAYAGVLGMTGEANNAPIIPGVQLADIAGGSYMTVIATLSALHARTKTGKGQHVDVAMTDAVMPLLSAVYALEAGGMSNIERGKMPLSGGMPNYGVYRCQDGKYVALGTLEPKFWSKFCTLVNQPEWIAFILPKNEEQLAEFKSKIGQLFESQPQRYWIDVGLKNDLLISPVYDLKDLENDPHLQAREMIVTQEHPRAGKFKSIGIPIKFSETPAKPSWTAPIMGEDTEAILGELNQNNTSNHDKL